MAEVLQLEREILRQRRIVAGLRDQREKYSISTLKKHRTYLKGLLENKAPSRAERFCQDNQKSKEAKWNGYLSLKTSILIQESTQIETLILNPSSFRVFYEKYQKYLKIIEIGKLKFIKDSNITFQTDKKVLLLNKKLIRGRKPISKDLIKKIKYLQRRLTQKEIAEFLEVSQATVSNYLRQDK